ncbi:MAG TPA: hypothetical protein VN516_03015 [Candidatus Baltobacteraceae bacterium]|nr:hypothetical protein [Candidatus Baltobacteraceae bacterium]
MQKIESASDSGEWRAAAWLLEHCNPEKFARNRIEVTGADGSPIAAGMIQIYLPRKESIVEGNIIEAELSLPTERSKGEAN